MADEEEDGRGLPLSRERPWGSAAADHLQNTTLGSEPASPVAACMPHMHDASELAPRAAIVVFYTPSSAASRSPAGSPSPVRSETVAGRRGSRSSSSDATTATPTQTAPTRNARW
jgi:hypothetical protein